MKIVYATYIDNQEEIDYPIKFILSKIPTLIVYCSDEKNKNYLKTQGIESKIIGVKINSPIDISIAQNKCIDDIFETTNTDFVVWNQADVYITEIGNKIISDFCTEENISRTCSLGLLHLKLFHLCGFSYYGINVIGKKAWTDIKFTGDGAYLGDGILDYSSKEYASVDIGYLTIEQCRRHLNQHRITWNSDDNICNEDDSDFVKTIIKNHNYNGLITEDSEYYALIKEMNLVDEYNKVKSLC